MMRLAMVVVMLLASVGTVISRVRVRITTDLHAGGAAAVRDSERHGLVASDAPYPWPRAAG